MKDGASVEELVAAMIRFNEGAAHPPLGWQPPDVPQLGVDCVVFSPAHERVLKSDLVAYLEKLASPVLLVQTTQRGIIALTPLEELTGKRRSAVEHGLANQTAGLDHFVEKYGTSDSAPVVVEFEEEILEFPFSVLRQWAKRFILNIGWSVSKAETGSSAEVRLHLVRADRVRTKRFGEAWS